MRRKLVSTVLFLLALSFLITRGFTNTGSAGTSPVRSLWVGEEQTAIAVSLADGQPRLYISTEDLEDIAVDNSRGVVWVGTKKEIIQYNFDGTENMRHPIGQNTSARTYDKQKSGNDAKKAMVTIKNKTSSATSQDATDVVRISLDPFEGSLWVGVGSEVIKLSSDNRELFRMAGFDHVIDVSVDISDGSCWVAEKHKIRKYSSDGTALFNITIDEYIFITVLAADPVSHSLWVGTEQGLGKINALGQELFRTAGPVGIRDMEVNSATGSLLLVTNKYVYKYGKDNQQLLMVPLCPDTQQTEAIALKSNGINTTAAVASENTTQNTTCGAEFTAIAVDSVDNTIWVATTNTLYKGSDAGDILLQVPGFINIKALDIGLPKIGITITGPVEGAIVDAAAITVKGTITGPASTVTVNGLPASVTGNLFEVHGVPLSPGLNIITATAVSSGGLSATDTVHVTYTPVVPPLPPLTIKINSPQQSSTFTTSRITVTGTVSDPAATVLVNNTPAVVTGTMFTATNIQLTIGENTLTAVAVDPLARTGSDTIGVTYTWLKISITYPSDGDIINQPITEIEGTVSDPFAYVDVNGKEAEVAPDGTFIAFRVPLSPGPNEITAQAANSRGQTDTASVQVTYQPPSQPLEISILSPTDGAVIETPTITVKGVISDPTAFVLVNDVPAGVEDTIFTANVPVCERPAEASGAHRCSIMVTAYADDGRRTLSVTDYTYFPSQDPLTVRITNPSAGRTVFSPLVTITGEIHDALANITPTAVTINGAPAEVRGNTFTASVELTDGKNYFLIRAVNMLGHDAFDGIYVIYEPPSKPLQVMITAPIDRSIVNYSSVPVSGSVSDSTATVAINGAAVALDYRSYKMPSLPLTIGENIITATAERLNSDPAEASVRVTYDPAYPSPPAPLLGELPKETSRASLEVSGLAAPGYRVEILVNGEPGFFLINPDANGLFKTSVGLPLEGPNHISARTVDSFGNKSIPSNEAIVIRDTLKPYVHNVENYMHSLNLAVSRVQLMGGTEAGAKVELTIDHDPDYTYQTTANDHGGFFIITNLSAGRHYVDIYTTDRVGNKAWYSKGFFVHVPAAGSALGSGGICLNPFDPSCKAASVSTNTPMSPTIDPIPTPMNETSITVEGNAYAGFNVEVYRNNELMGTTYVDKRGRFSVPNVSLVSGTNIIKARQQESQVDMGTRYRMLKTADSKEVAVDVTSEEPLRPELHIAFPMNGSVINGQFLPVRGTVSPSVATVRMNGGYYSESNYSQIANNSFVGNSAIPLLPGRNVLWAEASAADGTRGVDKIIVYSRKDAVVPSVTITSPQEGQTIYEQLIQASGIAGDTARKIIINETEATGVSAFTGTVDLTNGYAYSPDDGRNLITAWAMDQAGNIGHHEVHLPYQYVTPPSITITSPSDGQIVSTPTVTITGTVSNAFEVLVNNRAITMNGNTFSALLDLAQGQNTINVIAKNSQRATARTIYVTYMPASLTLESIALYPAVGSLPVGRTRQLTALGTYSNDQTIDLTLACTWTSGNSSIASVNNGLVRARNMGETIITASLGTKSASAALSVTMPELELVVIAYETPSLTYAYDAKTISPGQGFCYRAFGLYNGGYIDVTQTSTWTSNNPPVASINNGGCVTAYATGTTEITATTTTQTGRAVTGSTTLVVVPPRMDIFITSPTEESVDTSTVTVTGKVFTTAREVGITVNGTPATVFGNQYTVNNVPLSEGINVIKASAIDSNGATAGARIDIGAVLSANPITITANIESGIAPLETVLRVDGYAVGTTPNITSTGPGTVDFTNCISYDACRVRMTAEGIYYFAATGTGTDGNTYKDTVAVTVLNRTDLDALLKAKWEGMKGALASGNVEGAVGYFIPGSQGRYKNTFTLLQSTLSSIASNMQNIELIYVTEKIAKYRIRRDQVFNGQMETITYYIYFSKNQNGMWQIEQF